MSIVNLSKNEKINLSKSVDLSKSSGLSRVKVGLGWDENRGKGFFSSRAPIDCDAFALLLRGPLEVDCVYYGHLEHKTVNGLVSVKHTGDNLTGEGDGDDEVIICDLKALANETDRIMFGVSIYGGERKNQTFGNIKNAFIRIEDCNTRKEFCRFKLDGAYDGYCSVVFGEMVNTDGDWVFSALGTPYTSDKFRNVSSEYIRSLRA